MVKDIAPFYGAEQLSLKPLSWFNIFPIMLEIALSSACMLIGRNVGNKSMVKKMSEEVVAITSLRQAVGAVDASP
jgi:hypothetical protein